MVAVASVGIHISPSALSRAKGVPMVNRSREASQWSSRNARTTAACVSALLAALIFTTGAPRAQTPRLHLNPVIAKLVAGKTVYGLNTGDLSLAYAREVAR